MSTLRCPACGARYAADARFCTRDGSRLVAPDAPEQPADSLPGQLLAGRYRVQSRVAEGGMAVVYAAEDVRTGEALALKVLAPVLTGDATAMTRLRREAELGGRLRHPNVCPILAMEGAPGGIVFVVMPFLAGETLAQRLQRTGPMPPRQVSAIVHDVAEGLHAAHGQGIVHRDLKPENVMVCPAPPARGGNTAAGAGAERCVVMDFGLATSLQARMAARRLTRTGMVMGTPEFMSPEQLRDEPLDARSDVYALALVACELLTGLLPFGGATQQEQMLARLQSPPTPLRELRAELAAAPAIEAVMRRGLAAEREDRFPTAPAFAAAFVDAVDGVWR